MTRPPSRLDDEYDAAAAHDLAAETAKPVGPGRQLHSTVCACTWVGEECPTIAEARKQHDAHRDQELGLQPAKGSRP